MKIEETLRTNKIIKLEAQLAQAYGIIGELILGLMTENVELRALTRDVALDYMRNINGATTYEHQAK